MIFKNLLLVTHSLLLPAWLTPAQANMTISQSDSEASASPAEKIFICISSCREEMIHITLVALNKNFGDFVNVSVQLSVKFFLLFVLEKRF